MSNQNDPRGEYTRVCPYFGDSFIADHLTRKYCPEKNGKKNLCKNRQKRMMDKLRKHGGIQLSHKNYPIEVFYKEKDLPSNDIDKIVRDAQINSNIKVLKEILGDKSHVQLTEIELLENGFDKEFFENSEVSPEGPSIFFIGAYLYFRNPDNNKIYITFKNSFYGAK